MSSILQRLSSRGTAQRKFHATRSGVGKTRCIGIDIDVDAVRVAALGRSTSEVERVVDGGKHALHWTTYTKLPLDNSPEPHGESSIDSPKKLRRWMDQLLDVLPRTIEGYRNIVTLCLPHSWTHYEMTREVDLPSTIASCQTLFKNSIFQCDLQSRVWNACKSTDRKVVVAVPRQATLEIARGIRRLGYEVSGILPPGIALAGAASALTTLDPICVATIGRLGGFVSTIGCGTDRDQLQGLCRHVPRPTSGTSPSSEQISLLEDIGPQLSSVAHEIVVTMSYANRINEFRGNQAKDKSPVLIAGDLAATPGLDEALASRINLPVAVWRYAFPGRPLSSFSPSDEMVDAEAALSLSLAHLSSTMLEQGWKQ